MSFSKPALFYALFSPPSRACLLTSKLIGLNLELKTINLAKKEQYNDWFLKLNPRHTVPVLVDDGISLGDSHAILIHMVCKYGHSHQESLYPTDLQKRAIVNDRLYYNASELSQVMKSFVKKVIYGDAIALDRATVQDCHISYEYLEKFLTLNDFVAGKTLSIADISINTTLTTLHTLVKVDEKRYPKIHAWMHKLRKEIPDYEDINEKGAQMFLGRFQNALEENMSRN